MLRAILGNRRRSRELALQTLYSMEFGHRTPNEAIAEMRERANESPTAEKDDEHECILGAPAIQSFAEILVRGVSEHLDEIDALIAEYSTNWKVTRMAIVDRNILRMATFELHHLPEIPPKVTLNEAVEIAKRYSSQDSGAFINGILDSIASVVESSATT